MNISGTLAQNLRNRNRMRRIREYASQDGALDVGVSENQKSLYVHCPGVGVITFVRHLGFSKMSKSEIDNYVRAELRKI